MSGIIQYIPANINLDEMLRQHPPAFSFHRDYFIFLLHLITALPSRKKGMLDRSGFVPLNAKVLKRYVHDYRPYLDYLLARGIIETDNHYKVGEKSIGYRFTNGYSMGLQKTAITKFTLVKALNKDSRFRDDMQKKYRNLHKWFDDKLTLDFEAAAVWLRHKLEMDISGGVKNAEQKYSTNLLGAMQLRYREYIFHVDKTSYRLHTNLTSLNKNLRHFITYGGRQLVSLDVRCSQPTLVALLLQEGFYRERDSSGFITLDKISQQLAKEIDVKRAVIMVKNNPMAIGKYVAAVQADFYLYMKNILQIKGADTGQLRKQIKDMVFTVLYSDNKFIAQDSAKPKRMFREVFPLVYDVLKLFKRNGAADLPILLQKVEAEIMLNRVAKRISVEQPNMPIYTIHDSIVCPVGCESECVRVIEEEFKRSIGILPSVKTEIWQPENPSGKSYNPLNGLAKLA